MAIINLPPAVDLNYYRQVYPELNNFHDDVIAEHCKRFAVEQGRSTCFYDRREFLQAALQKLIDDNHLKALEISPFDNIFLRGVSNILNKGGVYVLIIPDKRYCFDHYNLESTIGEVMDAFISKRKYPRLANFINTMMPAHNDAIRHWLGEHGKVNQETAPEKLLLKMEKYSTSLAKGDYLDNHNWKFTPDNFGYIINMLNKLTLIDLSLYRLCHTVWGRLEFVAMLEKI